MIRDDISECCASLIPRLKARLIGDVRRYFLNFRRDRSAGPRGWQCSAKILPKIFFFENWFRLKLRRLRRDWKISAVTKTSAHVSPLNPTGIVDWKSINWLQLRSTKKCHQLERLIKQATRPTAAMQHKHFHANSFDSKANTFLPSNVPRNATSSVLRLWDA